MTTMTDSEAIAVLDEAVKVLNDARIGGFADSLGGVSEDSVKNAFRRIAGRLAYAEQARAHIAEALRDAEKYRFLRDSAACSLTVNHNDHHCMYRSVADTLDDSHGYYDDIGENERATMISTDTIWTVHIYPNTPVGFNVYHGATLCAAIDAAMKDGRA